MCSCTEEHPNESPDKGNLNLNNGAINEKAQNKEQNNIENQSKTPIPGPYPTPPVSAPIIGQPKTIDNDSLKEFKKINAFNQQSSSPTEKLQEKEIVEFDVHDMSKTVKDPSPKRSIIQHGIVPLGDNSSEDNDEPKIIEINEKNSNEDLVLMPFIQSNQRNKDRSSFAQQSSNNQIKLSQSKFTRFLDPKFPGSTKEKLSAHLIVPMANTEFVYLEGELPKYKPGISALYINRWCQITKTCFNYFKNNWEANCWLSKPMLSIPLSCVQAVRPIKLITSPTKKSLSNNARYSQERDSHFEIYLKENVNISNLHYSSDYSQYDTTRGSLVQNKNQKPKIASSPIKTRKQRSTSLRITHKFNKSVIEGHLIRTPDRSAKHSQSMYNYEEENDQILSGQNAKSMFYLSSQIEAQNVESQDNIELEGIYFKNQEELSDYEKFCEQNYAKLCNKKYTEKVSHKKKPGWAPTISSILFFVLL